MSAVARVRRAVLGALAVGAVALPSLRAQTAAPPSSDPAAVLQRIAREGLDRSRVEADLRHLTDVIGPRLTGTSGLVRANNWAADKLLEYGADSAWLEPFPFGRAWERGPMTLTMLAPHRRQLIGASWAWAPGTNGPVTGPVVNVDAKTTAEFTRRFSGRLRGAWVMTAPPYPMPAAGGLRSAADSAALAEARRAYFDEPDSRDQRVFRRDLLSLLVREGAAGAFIDAAKEGGLLTMSGSPSAPYPIPHIVIPSETYRLFHRLGAGADTVRIRADIANTLTRDSVLAYNTIGELRGTEAPDEVVLIGAHLDSWDLATGATDNGAGAVAVLEAARILKAAGVRPRRTIRFALFGGEEQGLYGSIAYVTARAAELPRHQAALIVDNGTGRIVGVPTQGRDDLAELWRGIIAPIAAIPQLGPIRVRNGLKGGTDHLPFAENGVPSVSFDQEPRGYDRTHHSQLDSFEYAVPADIRQAATVLAAMAYRLATMPELIPRR